MRTDRKMANRTERGIAPTLAEIRPQLKAREWSRRLQELAHSPAPAQPEATPPNPDVNAVP